VAAPLAVPGGQSLKAARNALVSHDPGCEPGWDGSWLVDDLEIFCERRLEAGLGDSDAALGPCRDLQVLVDVVRLGGVRLRRTMISLLVIHRSP
jgi:hypothetical protein